MAREIQFIYLFVLWLTSIAGTPPPPTTREKQMIDEINFARTRPAEYSKYIDDYLEYWAVDDVNEIKEAEKLRQIMLKMQPLKPLQFSPKLYTYCVKHGVWMKRTGEFEHSDFNFNYGENLCAGNESVRLAVIDLLIDYGVPGYGHRENLFFPNFQYVAVHEIPREVGNDEFVFIQQFSFENIEK